MAIKAVKIEPHWNYFLAIERDLVVLSRFLEFDERNFRCFSLEVARILLSAGAEADVVCKQTCRTIDPRSLADNIHAYRDAITQKFPGIKQFVVEIPRFGLTLFPWDEWKKPDGVPIWWTAYNKIKHERTTHYHKASLRNALNAVAGLFVANLYLYPSKAKNGELVPSPELLRPGEVNSDGVTVGLYETGFNYRL